MVKKWWAAAGVRVGNNPPNMRAGSAPDAVLVLSSTTGAGTLTTGSLTVGVVGVTGMGGGGVLASQNKASMTIGKDVTVDVTQNGTPGDVLVGGATVGKLTVDQGKLKARTLSAGGVSGQAGGNFVTQVSVSNGAVVKLTGRISIGAANGNAGPARRGGTATFNVSLFTSRNGVTPDTPNVAVPGAALGWLVDAMQAGAWRALGDNQRHLYFPVIQPLQSFLAKSNITSLHSLSLLEGRSHQGFIRASSTSADLSITDSLRLCH